MKNKIKCFFGFHNWKYYSGNVALVLLKDYKRACENCGHVEWRSPYK